LCGAATWLAAQGSGSIAGTVKDQSGAALAGATVQATNTASGRAAVATSDSSGKYEFNGLPPGPYRVVARQAGFSDGSASVSLGAGESASHDFSLNVGTLEADVTVTAARGLRDSAEIPQTVTTVTAADIEQRRPVGVADAYDRAPSMLQTDPNPFRARPQIRGLQSSRILVLVDGERLNNARFAADFVGVSPSLVDPTQIQSVEIVAGSSSSLYGSDAIGGTVNIVTKGPQRTTEGALFTAKLNADYNSNSDFRRGAVQLGYGIKQFALTANVSRFVQSRYEAGGEAINRADVVRFGQLAVRAGAAVGQNIITAYPVYDLPANSKIDYSEGNGTNFGSDMMFFLGDKQTVRVKGQSNRFGNLGVPFSFIPGSTNGANTRFSRLNKFSLRYEATEITGWLARFSASYYWQDYERSLDENRFAIVAGSSFVSGPPPTFTSTFTGNVSTFLPSVISQTINKNSGPGFDIQANIIPFKDFVYTTGVNYSKDESRDRFAETRFSTTAPTIGNVTSRIADRRNTPFSDYKNLGWYNQFEYTAARRLRLAGGFRIDRWETEAMPTPGFAVGSIGAIVAAVLPAIQANPQSLNPNGLNGLSELVAGTRSLETNNTVGTYNISATGLTSVGVNPYIRYSTSFHEPEITSRYLVRNFSTSSLFSLPSLINTGLRSERGRDFEFGVKVDRQRFRGSAGYFRNRIRDASGTGIGSYCVAPNPAAGIIATPPGFSSCPINTHLVQVFQTINFARVELKGFEGVAEADLPLGKAGSLTPYFTFSTLKAQNQRPDANRVAVVNAVYNSSAPLPLEGSANDVPFYSLPKTQGAFAPRYTSKNGRVWAEYEYRWTSRIERVDPNDISFAGTTTFSFFKAYEGLSKQSIRGGFRVGRERSISVTLGVENLTDNLYFLLFQPAPAQGRAFTVGTTINLSKKF
jgi:hemoglobin/transferrin/lactoferrin receptor protein